MIFVIHKIEKLNTMYGIDVEYCKNYQDIITNIFDNDNLNYDLTDKNILNIIGTYYRYKIKNYDEMKKYYLMAIELNNVYAMDNLGSYYIDIEENYDEMKKYYLMAIELNHVCAMHNLGLFYQYIEQNYDEMKKYYLMGINTNHNLCLACLCNFYDIEIQHYLLRQINSTIAIEKVKQLEKNNFLGVKIFKELTEYCFNPQRLLKLCNIYEIELNDYMDII